MRRSPGMGGGSVLRAVGRAVGSGVGGVKEAVSAGSSGGAAVGRTGRLPARVVCVSSPSSGTTTPPTSSPSFASASAAAATSNTVANWNSHYTFLGDGEEWERVGVEEELEEGGEIERLVFGTVPSKEEVEDAVSTIQQIFVPVTFSQVMDDGSPCLVHDAVKKEKFPLDSVQRDSSTECSTESESDWIEPVMYVCTNSYHSKEHEKVVDAFRLLKINPSVQKMVASLSSDKAVWDAVMKNEVVQELKKSFSEVENNGTKDHDEHPNFAGGILGWLFDNAKSRLTEFVDNIIRVVNEIFHSGQKNEKTDIFEDAVKTSFMLSVVVFIVVVVTRIHKA